MDEIASVPGWKRSSLLSLADYHNGAAFNPSHWGEEGLPIIRIEQINDPSAPTDFYSGPLIQQNFVTTGDLIFSWSATLKAVLWRNGDGALNQHLFKVVPKNGTDKTFLKYVLEQNMERIAASSQGSTMKHITRGVLRRYHVEVPRQEADQRRIAEILSTLADTIEQTEALIAKHQQIKAGLTHDLFTRGVTPDGHLRPTCEQAPHLYKDSPLRWIPKEWEGGGVEKYLIQPAGMKPGPFGSSLTKSVYTESGYRVYGQEQILANSLAEGDYYVSASKWVELRDFAVAEGDILMTLVGVGTVGKVLVVREPFEPGIINPRVMRLRPNKIACSIEFLRQLISSSLVRSQFNRFATGGTMPVLNASVVRMVRVPIVPITEQQLIASVLSSHDARLAIERKLCQKLLRQKHGLMQDLLTGRVRVKVGEPTST